MSESPNVSNETLHNLIENTSKAVGELYPVLKQEIQTLQVCGKETSSLLRLTLELRMDLHFILLSLAVSLHSLFVAERPIEKRFHLRYLLAELHEDYKLLYGYGKAKSRAIWSRFGVELKNLRKSKECNVENSLINLYDTLSTYLCRLEATSKEKNGRDLTFHYDDDFTLVYQYALETDNEETASLKAISFIDVALKLQIFCDVIELAEATNGNHLPIVKDLESPLLNLQKLFAQKLSEGGNLKETLRLVIGASPNIDNAAKMKGGLERIRIYIHGLTPTFDFPELDEMETLTNTQLLLQFTRSDLAIATQGYIKSKSAPEFPLIMRRLTITRVSALGHLYGYSELEKEKSMWRKIVAMIPTGACNLLNAADEIETMFRGLIDASDKSDRQLYVHLSDNDGMTNIPRVVERLEHMNPVKEFEKTALLMRMITKVQLFLRDLMNQMAVDARSRSEANTAKMLLQIQAIRDAVNGSKSPEALKAIVCSQMDSLERMVNDPLAGLVKK